MVQTLILYPSFGNSTTNITTLLLALALQCLRNKEKFFNFPKKVVGQKTKGLRCIIAYYLVHSLHLYRLGPAADKVMDLGSDTFGNPFIQKILQNYLCSPMCPRGHSFLASSKKGPQGCRNKSDLDLAFIFQTNKVGAI